jgi:hypothetical protein
MESETNSAAPTPTASKQEDADAMRNEIVRNLAELLVRFDGLLELSNELDRKGYPNQLDPRQSEEEAERALLMLVENHPNLLNSDVPLRQVMKSDPHGRGEWALDTFMANLSNEDSS